MRTRRSQRLSGSKTVSLVEEGQLVAAANLASIIDNVKERDDLWDRIAESQADRHLFAEAKATITKLSTALGQAQTLTTSAAVAGRAGEWDDARKIIAEAEDLLQCETPDDFTRIGLLTTSLNVITAVSS
jgi:multidrug efflux pump subunit AcrA (membrane-fusion protein)